MIPNFHDARLMWKVLFLHIIFFLMFIVIFSVGVRSIVHIRSENSAIYRGNVSSILNLITAQETLTRLSMLRQLRIVTTNPATIEEIENEMLVARQAAEVSIELFLKRNDVEDGSSISGTYIEQYGNLLEGNSVFIDAYFSNNLNDMSLFSDEQFVEANARLVTSYNLLLTREQHQMNEEILEHNSMYGVYILTFVSILFISLLVLGYSFYIIRRRIMLPLLDIRKTVASLATLNPDDEHASADRQDEIGDIASALQVLRAQKLEAGRPLSRRLYARAETSALEPRSVLTLVPIGILLSRPSDGVILDVNPALREIFEDLDESLADHTSLNKLLDPVGRLPLGADWNIAGEAEIGPLECGARTRRGNEIVLQLHGLGLHGEHGEALLLTLIHDITVQRAHEETLREERDRADDANRAKSRFLANVTHEIRTPMNGVLGLITRLLKTGLNEEQTRVANLARTTGNRLLGLLTDLLEFSAIESGAMTVEHQVFGLGQIVTDCVELHRATAAARGLLLELDITPMIAPRYLGDAGKINQIVSNLLSNALKFTDTGSVKVELAVAELSAMRHRASIRVVDTGIGMTAAQQARVFDPFIQADESTKRAYGGFGLGLSIVLGLADLLGGRIELESTLGAGSSFTCSVDLDVAGPEVMPL